MDSRDPIKDFFSFLLGAVLLSMGAFLFFNQVMVSSGTMARGFRYGHGFGRSWGGGYGSGFGGGDFAMPLGFGDSFGLLLIPLVIGVCLLFALRNQRWGWFLVLASVAALRWVPGVNYVGGSRQLRRRVPPLPPPAMAGGGDSEN
jgi:hypothetical protein